MSEWISVEDRLPSKSQQVEVVFYAEPYAWETGLFTPANFYGSTQFDDVFDRYVHDAECDYYEKVEGVTHWLALPPIIAIGHLEHPTEDSDDHKVEG